MLHRLLVEGGAQQILTNYLQDTQPDVHSAAVFLLTALRKACVCDHDPSLLAFENAAILACQRKLEEAMKKEGNVDGCRESDDGVDVCVVLGVCSDLVDIVRAAEQEVGTGQTGIGKLLAEKTML